MGEEGTRQPKGNKKVMFFKKKFSRGREKCNIYFQGIALVVLVTVKMFVESIPSVRGAEREREGKREGALEVRREGGGIKRVSKWCGTVGSPS